MTVQAWDLRGPTIAGGMALKLSNLFLAASHKLSHKAAAGILALQDVKNFLAFPWSARQRST
eukprot:scaffold127618_cov15-Tisochrysis_lutea.AAC.1